MGHDHACCLMTIVLLSSPPLHCPSISALVFHSISYPAPPSPSLFSPHVSSFLNTWLNHCSLLSSVFVISATLVVPHVILSLILFIFVTPYIHPSIFVSATFTFLKILLFPHRQCFYLFIYFLFKGPSPTLLLFENIKFQSISLAHLCNNPFIMKYHSSTA